jgi:membrane-bound serine protease (ClpP class)
VSDDLLLVGALIAAGYLLLLLEAFVIPGFGLAGLAALVCLGLGCLLAFQKFDTLPATALLAGVVAGTTWLLWWIPRTRFGRDIVLKSSLGYAHSADDRWQPGQLGVAESDLRPAGIARFGEERESVVTEGEYVSRGAAVRIVEVRGSRVVVEPAEDESTRADGGGD